MYKAQRVSWPEAVSDRIRRKICQYFVAIMRSVTLKAGRQNEQFPPTVQELRKRLLSFCQKHPIIKLEVFGSIADGTAKPGSDVDLMVTFRPGAKVGIEFLDMIFELEELLGCSVTYPRARALQPWKTGSSGMRSRSDG